MGVHAVKFFSGLRPTAFLMVFQFLVDLTMASKNGFYFEYLDKDFRILKLRCQAGVPPSDGDVISITIFNATTTWDKMAWVAKGREPTTGSLSMDKNMFLAGSLSTDHYHTAKLEILMIEYQNFLDQKFGCNVTKLNRGAEYERESWMVMVNKTVSLTTETTTTPGPFTDAPYRIGAVKNESEIDTDSLPMTVLIVMLVLISILLFLAVFLLLHRYRSRCQRRDEDLYRPPAYCLAPDHHLDWGDNSSTLKSKGSARTLNSRSHYSIAAHHMHMPLPPIPHSTVPRRGRTEAAYATVAPVTVAAAASDDDDVGDIEEEDEEEEEEQIEEEPEEEEEEEEEKHIDVPHLWAAV